MKKTIMLALVLLNVLTVTASHAATKSKAKKKPANPNAKLETSFKFDGSALRGKYQTSLSTTATVENDKFLEDLMAGRKQFDDRAEKEQERN